MMIRLLGIARERDIARYLDCLAQANLAKYSVFAPRPPLSNGIADLHLAVKQVGALCPFYRGGVGILLLGVNVSVIISLVWQ